MRQTAVEWFYQRILAKDIKEVFEQAKEIEKKDICHFGAKCCFMTTQKKSWTIEELYNETFKK
jgi:hypothetical protein